MRTIDNDSEGSGVSVSEPVQLGMLIRRLRLASGLSQEQLAERSGLSARAVSDLERGQRAHTRPETLRMLAEGLALDDEDRQALLHAARPELQQTPKPTTTGRPPSSRLPAPPMGLIGRDREVTELVSRLTDGEGRLTTLTGPGGVGKTRLALEAAHLAAHSFPDGAVFVDLAPVTDSQLVPSTIAQALGIHESGERSIRETLSIALRNRRLLLLLDNFEQVIEAAPLVADLLASVLELYVLVTSREALRIRGEEEIVIQPLGLPTEFEASDLDRLASTPAVALFVETGAKAKPGFVLAPDNSATIVEICRRLDGLPLAIELAAARVKHFPPVTLLAHLERRLPVLTGGPRDLPARQQTLRDTIAWSYDLLSSDEQTLFRRLGVFAGGASLSAIEVIAPSAGELEIELLSGLASLLDKSLLKESIGHDGTPRFSMLELIREFAADKLVQAGEADVLQHALAGWVLGFVQSWSGDDYHAFLPRLANLKSIDDDLDNIRSAIGHFSAQGDAEACATLFISLFNYFYYRGRFREAATLGYRALECADEHLLSDRLRGLTLSNMTILETMLGEASRGELLGREGLLVLRRSPENFGLLPKAMIGLAIALREQGRYADAMVYADQAFADSEASGNQDFASFALYHVGKLAFLQKDLSRAAACLTDSLRRSKGADPSETALYSAIYLAAVHISRGDLREAAALLREADQMWRETGSGIAAIVLKFAGALAAHVQPINAVRLFGADAAQDVGFGVKVVDEPWIADVKSDLREQLGEVAFEAAYRAGQGLSLDDAQAMMRVVLDQIERDAADNKTPARP